jgi:branched-chain amino acid transport system substrate-binding protein
MNHSRFLKRLGLFVLAVVLAGSPLLLAGCQGGEPAAKPRVKIGLSLCYTGPAGEKGRVMSDGILDVIQYINEELGGVAGYRIEVMWRDNEYNTAKAVTILSELMEKGNLLFGTNDSTTMKASMENANRNNFPGIAVFSSPELTNPPKHIYAQLPDYGDDWTAFSNYYLKNIWKGTGKPKMALHLLNNPTGAGAKQAAQAGAEKLGIEIVAIEEHTTTTMSEIESLTRIKAKNPDVIYISSTPAPSAIIVKDMVKLGMHPGVTIGLCHAGITSAFVDAAGATVAEGVYGVYPTVAWGENVPGMAKMTEYVQKLHPKDQGNADYITTWSEGLIIAEILRLAIKNVGVDKLTPQNVEESGIKKLQNFDPGGLHGPVSYTVGDNRLAKTLRINKITGGKITAITGWIDAPKIEYNCQ